MATAQSEYATEQAPTSGTTMKAARLYQYDPAYREHFGELLRIEEIEKPAIIRPDDVIVRVGAAGLCRTDLHIIEGIWKDKTYIQLPYIPGHENAGWVEEVGSLVSNVQPGDAVICHPVTTDGLCPACRRGEDMYCEQRTFPGLDTNGGFAEYLRTSARSLIKLPPNLAPVDVAPYADAGITAYRAAKKAAAWLKPGDYVAVVGVGGLGHIGVQVLRALCAAQIIAVDRSERARKLATEVGADYVFAVQDAVEAVKDLTGGTGAHAVIDFVGEGGALEMSLAMLRMGGIHYVVGYGGTVNVPAIDVIARELAIVGSLVGNYAELQELMTLAGQGKVKLHTVTYPLDRINDAIRDLEEGQIAGRAVIMPSAA